MYDQIVDDGADAGDGPGRDPDGLSLGFCVHESPQTDDADRPL
jgi:hypothetical protein